MDGCCLDGLDSWIDSILPSSIATVIIDILISLVSISSSSRLTIDQSGLYSPNLSIRSLTFLNSPIETGQIFGRYPQNHDLALGSAY